MSEPRPLQREPGEGRYDTAVSRKAIRKAARFMRGDGTTG